MAQLWLVPLRRSVGLLPPERVDKVVDPYPDACDRCHASLTAARDAKACRRYQSIEVPPQRAELTEYRQHSVTCLCGRVTKASVASVPASPFGPRLTI